MDWFLYDNGLRHERVKNHRSSRPEVFCKKGVPRNFANFTRKHLPQNLFFNKVTGLRLHLHYMNFEKFLRAPFIAGHLRWLFLKSLLLSFLKCAVTDMRYFARSKFSMILGHKKNFSLI